MFFFYMYDKQILDKLPKSLRPQRETKIVDYSCWFVRQNIYMKLTDNHPNYEFRPRVDVEKKH